MQRHKSTSGDLNNARVLLHQWGKKKCLHVVLMLLSAVIPTLKLFKARVSKMPMPGCSRQAVILDVNSTFSRKNQILKSYGDVIRRKNKYEIGIFPTLFYNSRRIFAYMHVLLSPAIP